MNIQLVNGEYQLLSHVYFISIFANLLGQNEIFPSRLISFRPMQPIFQHSFRICTECFRSPMWQYYVDASPKVCYCTSVCESRAGVLDQRRIKFEFVFTASVNGIRFAIHVICLFDKLCFQLSFAWRLCHTFLLSDSFLRMYFGRCIYFSHSFELMSTRTARLTVSCR